MSYPVDGSSDLFIPVGPSKSRSSSIATGFTADTGSASVNPQSTSTSPTTASSGRSPAHLALQKNKTRQKSRIRYTISAAVHDEIPAPDPGPKAYEPLEVPHANNVHITRRGREPPSSVSPIQDLTLRLSNAIQSADAPVIESAVPQLDKPDASAVSDSIHSTSNVAAPTPFASPEILPVPVDISNLQSQRTSPLSIDSSSALAPAKASSSLEGYRLQLTDSDSRRSHSRSSSRSSREHAYPPASFPSAFYEKHLGQKSSQKAAAVRANMQKDGILDSQRHPAQASTHETGPRTFASPRRAPEQNSDQISTPQRSISLRSHSSPSTSSQRSLASSHAAIHHYSECSHTSPPATRPLNVQPMVDSTHDPPRSTITGACFECDTAQRRDMESDILVNYNSSISGLVTELSEIVVSLESMSPISPLSPTARPMRQQISNLGEELVPRSSPRSFLQGPDTDANYKSRRGSHSSIVSEEAEDHYLASQIHLLEDQIQELTEARDREVRNVWKGYTQRWGPGTLGVLKSPSGGRSSGASARSMTSRATSYMTAYTQPANGEGRMRLDWIRDTPR